mgnify:CR=1 FL=1
MSISDYYYDEINSEENLQELDNQEHPAYDEYKEERNSGRTRSTYPSNN